MTEAPKPVAVYRFYDAGGRLLYVGISTRPKARWYAHARYQQWWADVAHKDLRWYPDRPAARAEEIRVMDAEDPVHNIDRGHGAAPRRAQPRIVTARPSAACTSERLEKIRNARGALDEALREQTEAEQQLAAKIRAAYRDGMKTGPISHAAEWSDTYVRSIREGKVLQ